MKTTDQSLKEEHRPVAGAKASVVSAIGPGAIVLVVGPSGSGKDTLLRGAAKAVSGDKSIYFPRRLVTREVDPTLEDHETLSWEEYEDRTARGDAALFWQAHGLGYIVPSSVINHVLGGGTAVFNCSRSVIAEAAKRYRNVGVVRITVPDEMLARRLTARGRESAVEVKARLARADFELPHGVDVTTVVNDGTIEQGTAALVQAITNCSVRS